MVGTEERVIALRYAQAYLNVRNEPFSYVECLALERVITFYRAVPMLLFYLQIPLFTDADKRAALGMVRSLYDLPVSLESLDLLLLKSDRVFLVPLVYGELIRQSNLRAGRLPCNVTSAHRLSESERQICAQFVRQVSGNQPLITWQTDPVLIAGLWLQTEYWLWEDSLDARLKSMAHTLLT